MKSRGKQGKTGEKSQDPVKFAPSNSLVRNWHHLTPFVRNYLCEHFPKKHALGHYPKSQCKNAQECEPCVKLPLWPFSKKACSRSWKILGMRKFSHFTIHLMRNSHLFFKSWFLFLKSKLVLLQSSHHLFSDHSFPLTRSSRSSSPILNPPMASHLKSFIP